MSNPQFEASRKKLLEAHPDAGETLMKAHEHGLRMSPEALHEITRLGVPEVGYWLSLPQNQEAAADLMNLPAHAQVVRIGHLAKQLEESGQPFDPDTDDYIRKRRMDRLERKRR
jgi:hypothetical protein